MKKLTRKVTGVVLIVLGIAALLTPFTPGSWLIPIGLELLGLRILLQDRLLAWVKARPGSRRAWLICRVLRIHERDSKTRKDERQGCES